PGRRRRPGPDDLDAAERHLRRVLRSARAHGGPRSAGHEDHANRPLSRKPGVVERPGGCRGRHARPPRRLERPWSAESNTIDVIGWCSVDALWDDGRVNTISSLDCLGPRSDSLRAPAVARSRLTI